MARRHGGIHPGTGGRGIFRGRGHARLPRSSPRGGLGVFVPDPGAARPKPGPGSGRMHGCAPAGTRRSARSSREPAGRRIRRRGPGLAQGPLLQACLFIRHGAGSPPCWRQVKSAAGGHELPREAFGLGVGHRAGHLVPGRSRCPRVWLPGRGPARMHDPTGGQRALSPRPGHRPAAFLAPAARGGRWQALGGGAGRRRLGKAAATSRARVPRGELSPPGPLRPLMGKSDPRRMCGQ